jgi:CubicO group peptidase (beta-lactamase class C family)
VDLARLGAGVLDPKFLDPNAREEMFTPQKTQEGKETTAGLGWRVGKDDAGRRFVHHGGDTSGGRAFLLVYPDEGVAVALTTNLTFAPLGEKEARRLAEPFLKH